jgi:hypothetical protein
MAMDNGQSLSMPKPIALIAERYGDLSDHYNRYRKDRDPVHAARVAIAAVFVGDD